MIWGPRSGGTRGRLWSSKLHKEPHAPLLQGSRGYRPKAPAPPGAPACSPHCRPGAASHVSVNHPLPSPMGLNLCFSSLEDSALAISLRLSGGPIAPPVHVRHPSPAPAPGAQSPAWGSFSPPRLPQQEVSLESCLTPARCISSCSVHRLLSHRPSSR